MVSIEIDSHVEDPRRGTYMKCRRDVICCFTQVLVKVEACQMGLGILRECDALYSVSGLGELAPG